MKETLIRLRGIDFHYPQSPPLFVSLNFRLQAGDKIGLIGGNGAGKTTLLHLIVGLLKPASGEIFAFGQPRTEDKDFLTVRRQAGLLFQDPDDMLFCPTVLEDVAFGPLNLGFSYDESTQIAESTLAQLGIADFAPRITHQLSGGEKRLVTLAAVLAMQPGVLLLDEPTNALDTVAKNRLLCLLEGLPQSLILVSHEEDVVSRLTNKTVRIEKGNLSPS